jgi:hypothetical protein
MKEGEAESFALACRAARQAVPGATQEVQPPTALTEGDFGRVTVPEDRQLHELTRDELRTWAATYDIKGRGRMTKDQLINAIEARLDG